MARPKKAKSGTRLGGSNSKMHREPEVAIDDLCALLNLCVAKRPELTGFAPPTDSIPTWQDLEDGLLRGYVTALNHVLQFVEGDREVLAANLREGFLHLDVSSFSQLSQRQGPLLPEEAALGALIYLVPCTQCESAVSVFAASCEKCGTSGYIKTLLDDLQDASVLGKIAGRTDRTKDRPFRYTVDRWKNELESMGIKTREPELWETYLRKFESSYALGWEELPQFWRKQVDEMFAVDLGSVPDILRKSIESLKSTFGANWDQVVKTFHSATAKVIDDQRPWVQNSPEISIQRDFSTLMTELYNSGIKTLQFPEPGLEQVVGYMLSAGDSQDGYFVKDLSNTYVYLNPAMANLLERSGLEILGKSDRDLYCLEEAQILEEASERAMKGEMFIHEQTRLVRGKPKRFHEVLVPKRSYDGEVVGIYGISREVPCISVKPHQVSIGDFEYPSVAMRRTLEECRLVAPMPSAVLLLGESGSGKNRLAQYIHKHSRRSGDLREINCGAIPQALAESELFGHEIGAFTGATKNKPGFFELADTGTAFINEIGELPLSMQAKLLKILDDMNVQRLGSTKDIPVNVRIIAATNKDLRTEVAEGGFRQDLFYRLNVFSITVPPLRERLEDLPILADQLIRQLSVELKLSSIPGISAEAMQKLCSYAWPGNVRELRNVLEKALILSTGGEIGINDIKLSDESDPSEPRALIIIPPPSEGSEFHGVELSDEELKLMYEEVCLVIVERDEKKIRVGKPGSPQAIKEVLGAPNREDISRKLSGMECPAALTGRPKAKDKKKLIEDLRNWLELHGHMPTRS